MTQALRVLHVEDDADIREITELALAMVGQMTLVQCASGAEALAQAGRQTVDLLLLDQMMPGMSGAETLTALRDLPDYARTPVIFMTARAQQSDLDELKALGVAAIIPKPFEAMTLAQEIESIWQKCQAAV